MSIYLKLQMKTCMYWKILTDKNTENVITGNLDDKELTHLALTRMADEDYYNGIEGLNTQQKTAFELVQSYFKTLADFNDGLINTKPEPVHIYISGPGRTGKSHLITFFCIDNEICIWEVY